MNTSCHEHSGKKKNPCYITELSYLKILRVKSGSWQILMHAYLKETAYY